MTLTRHLGYRLIISAALLSPMQSNAENKSDDLLDLSIQDLLNLKVTVASLFEESELDAASSISVMRPQDWNKSNARRISDVLENVPSVASYPTWGGAEAIAIRGYATELSVRGLANTLNGVPLNTYTYASSLYDKPIINLNHLDRVEMIRGPGSTLYGSDAFHGVMAHKTRQEKSDTQTVATTLGTGGFAQGSSFFSHGLDNARINGGFAFMRQSPQDRPYQYTSPDDGLIYSSDRDYAYKDSSGFFTYSRGDANQNGLVEFTSYYARFIASGFPSSGTQFFVKLPAAFDLESSSLTEDLDNSAGNSQFWLNSLNYQYQLDGSTQLDARFYHWQSKQQWTFENDRYPSSMIYTALNVPFACKTATNNSPNPIYCPHDLKQSANEQRTGGQLYLKGVLGNTHWVTGIGRERFKINESNYARIALDNSVLIDESNPYEGASRHLLYALAQAKSSFVDNTLQLIYGLRWDRYSDLDSHISPRLGAIFKINDHYTSKLLYGHAYRAPTALEKAGSVDSIVENPDIKPEKIDTLEWVNVFYDKDYSAEVTLFASQWKDGIVLTPTVAQRNKYFNTGDNESYGIEFSGTKQVDQYQFNATASYVKSKNKEFDIQYEAFPEWIFTLQGGRLFPAHNLELTLTQRIMLDHAEGDYITVIDGTTGIVRRHVKPPEADDYFRTDLSLVKHFNTLTSDGERSLVITLKNLFDQKNEIASLYNAESGIAEDGLSADVSFRWSW